MAFLTLRFYSAALSESTSVNVLLPDKREESFRTLWLLHGLSDDESAWMRYSCVERYARERSLAVVMPSAGRSWYTDTAYGKRYFTFLTEELPAKMALYFAGYSPRGEDNFIIGLSMGGYGAVKAALTCPEKYAFCGSLSGSLDVTRKNRPYDLDEWRSIFGFDIESAEDLGGTRHDLFFLAKEKKSFPYLYRWCGEEDSLLAGNRAFDEHLTALGIGHTFETSEGDHSWKWWDKHLVSALDCLFGRERGE